MVSTNPARGTKKKFKSMRKNSSSRMSGQTEDMENSKNKSVYFAPSQQGSSRISQGQKLSKKKKGKRSECEDLDDSARLNDQKTMETCEEVANDTTTVQAVTTVVKIPTRPPTSFISEKVTINKDLFNSDPNNFLVAVQLNPNMVVENLTATFMPHFLYGDQIYEVESTPVCNCLDISNVMRSKQFAKNEAVTFSVIRVWNYKCPTVEQLTVFGVYEKMSYVIVQLYRIYKNTGIALYRSKKRIRVSDLKPEMNAIYGLIANDSILEVKGFQSKQTTIRPNEVKNFIIEEVKTKGCVEIFVERAIGAESTPNPSIAAELMHTMNTGLTTNTTTTTTSNTQSQAMTQRETPSLMTDPPIEADAVEISLRELTRMQVAKAAGEHPLFCSLPSMLKVVEKKQEAVEVELFSPEKKTIRKEPRPRQSVRKTNLVNFKPKEKEVIIDSDIADGVDLKKVDAKSGFAAFVPRFF